MRVDGKLEPQLGLTLRHIAPERADRFADHPQVQVETHPRDVTGLLAAEEVTRTADLQVFERDLHTRAEVVVRRDRRETVVRGFTERLHLVVEEVGVGTLAPTTHPATQLVELAESVLVGAVDDEGVRIGDVEAGLDDGGGDQHVELALPEVDHHLFEHVLGQLAVGHGDPGFGNDLGDLRRDAVDRRNAVVHVEDLTLAQ